MGLPAPDPIKEVMDQSGTGEEVEGPTRIFSLRALILKKKSLGERYIKIHRAHSQGRWNSICTGYPSEDTYF